MKADYSNVLKNSHGFTLMEILVAVMLLAISLTIIMQQFSGGIRNIILTGSYTKAISHARNLMEEVLSEPSLLEGIQTGTIDEEFRWERVMKFLPPVKGKEASKVKELEIRVRVEWTFLGMARDFELVTIKAAITS